MCTHPCQKPQIHIAHPRFPTHPEVQKAKGKPALNGRGTGASISKRQHAQEHPLTMDLKKIKIKNNVVKKKMQKRCPSVSFRSLLELFSLFFRLIFNYFAVNFSRFEWVVFTRVECSYAFHSSEEYTITKIILLH